MFQGKGRGKLVPVHQAIAQGISSKISAPRVSYLPSAKALASN